MRLYTCALRRSQLQNGSDNDNPPEFCRKFHGKATAAIDPVLLSASCGPV